MLGMVRSISGRDVLGASGLGLGLCAGAAFVIWPDRIWIAQAVFVLGAVLFIGSVCLWFFANYRFRGLALLLSSILFSIAAFQVFQALTGNIRDGLYVGEIRFNFADLEKDRHSELTMRVFNGTGSVVEFSSLQGQIKFSDPDNTDPGMGTLPTPTLRSDTERTIAPFQEWLLILVQQVPSMEADKLQAMLKADIQIHFDLRDLTIEVAGAHDKNKVERLPIWGGVTYSRGSGFLRKIYGVGNILIK